MADFRRDSISIVIPAYNEEKRIKPTLERIFEYCRQFGKYEVIVVDDCSKDKTKEACLSLKNSNLRILKNNTNKGKGYSVKRGVLDAKYPIVLFSDSDLATPIEETENLMKHIHNGYDIAIASRNLEGSNIVVKQQFYRVLLGKTFPFIARIISGLKFKDTQCGFKMFKTEKAKKIFRLLTVNRFAFDVEALFIAKRMGCSIKEAPVTWINSPDTKVNPLKDSISMFIDVLKIRINSLMGKYE